MVLHVLPAGRAVRPDHRAPCCPPAPRRPAEAAEIEEAGATCASWRATSPPATPRPAPCAGGCAHARRTTPARPADDRTRTATTHDRTAHPRPRDPRDPRLPRREHLVLREGDPPRRRPRLAGEVPDQHHPRLHRQPARDAARACASTPARAASRGGFVERLNEGTWLGHVAEHAALALQQVVGHDIRRGKTRAGQGPAGPLQRHLRVRRRAGRPRRRPARRPAGQPPRRRPTRSSTGTSELEAFILRAERTAFGPSTQAILDEAVSRDIPWIRLNQYSLVQLGQGVHAKRIRATMTSATSAIAVDIASDKDLTTRLLGAAGLPGAQAGVGAHRRPGGRASPSGSATPSCVKPLDGNHGRGVCLDLQNEDDVRDGVPDRPGAVPARRDRRRVADHRQGLPLPGHRRPDRRDRRAGARLVTGDGAQHRRAARRHRQRRPAPRRRPREGADPDQGRRRRDRAGRASRATR